MAYRNYSDEFKAEVIAAYDLAGSVNKVAKQFNMPRMTAAIWIKNRDTGASAPPPELVNAKRLALADLFEELAYQAVGHTKNVMDYANPGEAATVAGIAVDKMRLLREQSTSITATAPQTEEEKTARLNELAAKHGLKLVA